MKSDPTSVVVEEVGKGLLELGDGDVGVQLDWDLKPAILVLFHVWQTALGECGHQLGGSVVKGGHQGPTGTRYPTRT